MHNLNKYCMCLVKTLTLLRESIATNLFVFPSSGVIVSRCDRRGCTLFPSLRFSLPIVSTMHTHTHTHTLANTCKRTQSLAHSLARLLTCSRDDSRRTKITITYTQWKLGKVCFLRDLSAGIECSSVFLMAKIT